MELTDEFELERPIDETWALLTDLALLAPHIPGAELQEVDGDDHLGTIRVTVGPISTAYSGVARVVERDPELHRVTIRASGSELDGQGTGEATIIARCTTADAGRTRVLVTTDLDLKGGLARFGHGVLTGVVTGLVARFAEGLHTAPPRPESAPVATPGSAPETRPSVTVTPTLPDGLSGGSGTTNRSAKVGVPLAKRALPLLGVAALGLVIVRWLVSRRRGLPELLLAGPTPPAEKAAP